jgi:hypothetical protein
MLMAVYLLYALFDIYEWDMINSIGFLIFQPLFGAILSGTTIAICLLIGLPIRLIQRIRQWWMRKLILQLLTLIAGFLLLGIAFLPGLSETQTVLIDEVATEVKTPNTIVTLLGWFITAFSLLHFYPQALWHWLKEKIFT